MCTKLAGDGRLYAFKCLFVTPVRRSALVVGTFLPMCEDGTLTNASRLK